MSFTENSEPSPSVKVADIEPYFLSDATAFVELNDYHSYLALGRLLLRQSIGILAAALHRKVDSSRKNFSMPDMNVLKLTYSVPEVCQALQISRTTLWKLIRSGRR